MKIVVIIITFTILSKASLGQVEIFKLKKQPASFYSSLNENDAVVSDSTAELIGNEKMIEGISLSFNLYTPQNQVHSDTTFLLITNTLLSKKFNEYAKNASLALGVPILFRIKGKPIFVAFVWNTVSSFGCDCIAAYPKEGQGIDFILGLGSPASKNNYSYYKKILSLYNYIKAKK